MTPFTEEANPANQPTTASDTSKTAPRPIPKITVGATRQAEDPHTRIQALDMEGEDEYLDIRPFKINPWKTAVTQKQDYSNAFNALNMASEENFPALKPTTSNPSKNTATTQKQGKPAKAVHWSQPQSPNKAAPQATDATKAKAPNNCTSVFCPVIKIHTDKPFKRDDWDLPEMIQHFQTHIDDLAAQGKRLPSHLVTLLDRFYTVHGTVGNFDVPVKPESVVMGSVGKGKKDVNAGSASDMGIITVRRLYPYKGVPDAMKLPLRPATQARNVNTDTAASTVVRGGSKHGDKDSAAENENGKESIDKPASRARVTQEALRLAFARLPSGR